MCARVTASARCDCAAIPRRSSGRLWPCFTLLAVARRLPFASAGRYAAAVGDRLELRLLEPRVHVQPVQVRGERPPPLGASCPLPFSALAPAPAPLPPWRPLPLPTLAHVLCVPPPQRAAGFATRRSLAGVGLSTSPAVQVGGGVDNETGEHSIKNHLGQTVALPAGEVSDLIAVEKERNRRYYVRAVPILSAPITPALAWATRLDPRRRSNVLRPTV